MAQNVHIEPVPVDISRITSKFAFGLTVRQIISFAGAAVVGLPVYLLTKGVIGNTPAIFLMSAVVMPFFLLAMYQKDGYTAEQMLYFRIRQKYLRPGIRVNKSEHVFKSYITEEVEPIDYKKKKKANQQKKNPGCGKKAGCGKKKNGRRKC